MKLILLAGKAESGKTTSSLFMKNYLEEQGIKVVKSSLAKYLKLYAKEISGYNEETDEKPRELLQNLGDTVRSIDKDFLLKRMDEDILVFSNFADYVIIDDIRLASEIEYLRKKYDCKAIKLVRDVAGKKLTAKQKKHSTETGLDNFDDYDKVIDNNGTLKELEQIIRNYLGEII